MGRSWKRTKTRAASRRIDRRPREEADQLYGRLTQLAAECRDDEENGEGDAASAGDHAPSD